MKTIVEPIIRAGIQYGAGFLASRGFAVGDNAEGLTSAVVFILSVAWSIYAKHKATQTASEPKP